MSLHGSCILLIYARHESSAVASTSFLLFFGGTFHSDFYSNLYDGFFHGCFLDGFFTGFLDASFCCSLTSGSSTMLMRVVFSTISKQRVPRHSFESFFGEFFYCSFDGLFLGDEKVVSSMSASTIGSSIAIRYLSSSGNSSAASSSTVSSAIPSVAPSVLA